MTIECGDPIEVREVGGPWRPAVARSSAESPQGGSPIICVARPGHADPVPWPAEDVRPYPQPTEE
jgi:hypothetical protein